MTATQLARPPVVLVVDDEALLRMLATDYFEDAGFEVLEAASGPEAMRILESRPDVHAIMTDVQMPGDPDGLGLAHAFRSRCPECAIVVVSGRVQPAGADLAQDAVFVTKPYDGTEMVETVKRLLAADR